MLVGSGYLHALNLVSLVRALVGVSLVRVLVGSDYLHALNLVSLVGVLGRFVVGVPLVNVPWSSCLGWCGYLHALNLVSLVGVLGGGYLHALNLVPWWLVSLVGSWLVCPLLMYLVARALVVRVGWKWLPARLGGWCVLVCLGGW